MNKDVKNVGLALIAGLAAGYAFGVLTAPKSGKETRQDIKDVSTKAYKAAEIRLKNTYEDLSEAIAEASKHAKKMSAKGKEELDVLLSAAHDAQSRIKQMISSVRRGEATTEDFDDAVVSAQIAKDELQEFLGEKN